MQPSSAPRGKILVAHPDRKAQRALQRLAGATQCPVEVVESIDALHRALDDQTIVVIDTSLAIAKPDLRSMPARAWIAVPGEGLASADAAIVDQLLAAGWDHIISHPMPILSEELLATIQKVVRGSVFGLEKYVAWGAEIRSYTLEDASDRDTAVNSLARDVVAIGLPERVGSLVSVIADELIANALYIAPVDSGGARARLTEPRDRPRPLTGRDVVTVRWASDARYLAVEVRDRWGSIDLAAIATRLAAGGKQAMTSEGGMGLPLAYACCNQFIVGCAPGAMTEVITLVDVRYKPMEIGRSASFHAFSGAFDAKGGSS